MKVETGRRPYRMVARAKSADATRRRILDAAIATFWTTPSADVSLDEVASRAGVSVQTVLRHFGSKDGLFEAAVESETARVDEQRSQAPVGDPAAATRVLVDHYEEMGEGVLRMLAEEQRIPGLKELADMGRAEHRAWCERVFASSLDGLTGVARVRRLAQLVAICDVYTWKLLRKDAGLSRRQTELALMEMLGPFVKEVG